MLDAAAGKPEMGKTVVCQVITSPCTSQGAPPVPRCGLKVISAEGCLQFHDLAAEADRLTPLIEAIHAGGAQLCHIEEIIDDWLAD